MSSFPAGFPPFLSPSALMLPSSLLPVLPQRRCGRTQGCACLLHLTISFPSASLLPPFLSPTLPLSFPLSVPCLGAEDTRRAAGPAAAILGEEQGPRLHRPRLDRLQGNGAGEATLFPQLHVPSQGRTLTYYSLAPARRASAGWRRARCATSVTAWVSSTPT